MSVMLQISKALTYKVCLVEKSTFGNTGRNRAKVEVSGVKKLRLSIAYVPRNYMYILAHECES